MIRIFIVTLLVLTSLTACRESTAEEIVRAELKAGDYTSVLYIPKSDFHSMTPHVEGDSSALLDFVYPEMLPLNKRTYDWYDEEQRPNKIRILISQNPKVRSMEDSLSSHNDFLKATELVEVFLGLEHYTQPEGGIKDNHDIWVDKDKEGVSSYITCSEQLTKSSVPQCSQYMYFSNLKLKYSYDKRLLKDWKDIKDKVLKLLESYQSLESAREYSNFRKTKTQKRQGE